jgi:hypothetical protein
VEQDEGLVATVTAQIVWREITRNCYVGSLATYLNGVNVVTVERPQKHRPDGTKHDWRIVVLGDRYTWNHCFCQFDPRDLSSTKMAAEARVRWAIDSLHLALHAKKPRSKRGRPESMAGSAR